MSAKTFNNSSVVPRDQFTTDSVTSEDGTKINYRRLGQGPGVVMLHGAMESAASHMRLAASIADAFTVYLPDRRGHTTTRNAYSVQKEVKDLDALLTKTGAHAVFGVSSGALICLQAALSLPALNRMALYEPALIVNGSVSTDFLPRYDNEMAQGNVTAALVTAMKGAKLGPPIFNAIPRPVMEMMTRMQVQSQDKNAKPGDVTMRMLAPTLHYDFQLVAEMAEKVDRFKAIQIPVLLLGGSNSPAWLKSAVDALEKALPNVKRVEFPGLDHGGSSDLSATNRNGKPEIVATALRQFFSQEKVTA